MNSAQCANAKNILEYLSLHYVIVTPYNGRVFIIIGRPVAEHLRDLIFLYCYLINRGSIRPSNKVVEKVLETFANLLIK